MPYSGQSTNSFPSRICTTISHKAKLSTASCYLTRHDMVFAIIYLYQLSYNLIVYLYSNSPKKAWGDIEVESFGVSSAETAFSRSMLTTSPFSKMVVFERTTLGIVYIRSQNWNTFVHFLSFEAKVEIAWSSFVRVVGSGVDYLVKETAFRRDIEKVTLRQTLSDMGRDLLQQLFRFPYDQVEGAR